MPSVTELRPEGEGPVVDDPAWGATWGGRGGERTRADARAGELSADLCTVATAAWANEPWTARARRATLGSPARMRLGAARPWPWPWPWPSGALAGSLQSRVSGPQGIGAFPMGSELAADPATEGEGHGALDWTWECWARKRPRWSPRETASGSWLGRAKEPHARRMAEGVGESGPAPSSAVPGGGAWGRGEERAGWGRRGGGGWVWKGGRGRGVGVSEAHAACGACFRRPQSARRGRSWLRRSILAFCDPHGTSRAHLVHGWDEGGECRHGRGGCLGGSPMGRLQPVPVVARHVLSDLKDGRGGVGCVGWEP